MKIDKAFLTNFIAFLMVILSFFLPDTTLAHIFLYGGLFALSGAITNQLAIHMLFEKVPFLYGSGVIESKFESFKTSIKELIMNQFFTKEQLNNFFAQEEQKINLIPIIEQTDFDPAYTALSKSVMESNFGGMLGMFGGESALESLREPFVAKLKSAIISIVSSQAFNQTLQNHLQNSTLSDDLIEKIDTLVSKRLDELTPAMVKEIVQNLIKEHLGWLVVWGGVFGGVIGVLSSFVF
jgi:uncharacterized membrane protein YheB (UPF0754 family)